MTTHNASELIRRKLLRWRVLTGILSCVVALLVGVVVWLLVWSGGEAPSASAGGRPTAGIQPILRITGPGSGAHPRFDKPLAAAFAPNGDIYVADTGHNRVCVFGPGGTFKFEFGGLGVAKPLPNGRYTWRPGLMNHPSGIAIDSAGNVFVADLRNNQIQVFDSQGTFTRRFPDPSTVVAKGASGYGGRGIAVTDVAVDNGRVFATDTYQIVEFDTTGRVIAQWGRPGPGSGDLDHPTGIAVSGDRVAVSDSNHLRVLGFSTSSAPLWGSDTATDSPRSARLELPRGLTKYGSSWLVADALGQGVVELSSSGVVSAYYGARGTAPGEFNFPTDVDARGTRVLVADKENNRVQVVGLTRGGR